MLVDIPLAVDGKHYIFTVITLGTPSPPTPVALLALLSDEEFPLCIWAGITALMVSPDLVEG